MTLAAGRATPRIQPGRPARPRLKLVPAPRLQPPRTPFVALIVGLLGAGLIGLLVLNTVIAENSFRMHELQKRTAALSLQEQQLQREIDGLEAPSALAVKARKLGMVPAGNPAFLRLSDGKILGVPTAARAPRPVAAASPAVRPTPRPAGTAKPTAPAPMVGKATPSPAPSPVVRR